MWHNNGQSFIEWFTIIFCVCDEYLYSNLGIINFEIEYAYYHISIPITSLNKIRLFDFWYVIILIIIFN